jgi:hypothetical protein
MKLMGARGIAVCFSLVSFIACTSEPGEDTDAGTPSTDSGTDAGTAADSGTVLEDGGVRFSPTLQIIDERGQVTVGQAGAVLNAPEPAALVPDGLSDGGVRVYPARHTGFDGYVIPGVPEGPYFLRFNGTLLWTDARQVDLRRGVQVQRSDLEWNVPAGTALDLRVSGLAPWQPADILRLSAPNGSLPAEDMRLSTPEDFGGALPPAGATSFDVRVSRFLTLLDGARGDSLWVQQLSESPGIGDGRPFTRVVRSFHRPAVPLTPGQVVPLDAPLTGGTERTVSFSVDATAFETQLRGAHPEARELGTLSWAIGARPGAEPFARLGSHPELAFDSVSIDATLAPYTVSFLDAFPEHWRRVAHVSSGTHVRLTSGSATYNTTLFLQRYDTLEGFVEAGTLAPRLGPVRNLRINGQAASAGLTGVGTTPTVSWEPPALGTATRYFVQVITIGGARQASVVTSETQVRLPPGLVPGTRFVVKVTATRGAGTASPNDGELPLDMAEALTGILSP